MAVKKKSQNNEAEITSQIVALKRSFPDGCFIKKSSNSFIWETDIQPTSLSTTYRIKITYKQGDYPDVFVVNPSPLSLFPTKKRLPHVYSTPEQKLCLFFKKAKELSKGQLIAKTILPWTSEWLFYYELWLSTGEWFGEGLHPEPNEKQKEK